MLFPSWLRSCKSAPAHLPRGTARRRPHTKRRAQPLGVELLEDRAVPSTAVISGPATAAAKSQPTMPDMPCTLRMVASEPASQWTLDWGDGTIDTLPGNPSRATHVFTTGQVVRNVSATAVINGQTVVASTSGEGANPGAFGNLPGVLGMVFGPDFNGDQYSDLYVTQYDEQTQANSLQAYDGRTGAFLQTLSNKGGFYITVGPDNDLYYGKGFGGDNCVFRYDFATHSASTFVAAGAGGLLNPTGLTFGPDLNNDARPDLFVASAGTNQILYYDGADGHSLGALPGNVPAPQGVTMGPDGNLYVSSQNANSVQRYDFASGTLSTFVAPGSGNLALPRGLTFGPDGDLYVVSWLDGHGMPITYGSYRVLQYDGATGEYRSLLSDWGRTDRSEVISPVVFGPDNNLYVGWQGTPLTTSGTDAPSCVERFPGPLTPGASTQLPVTVLKTFQKTYTNTKFLAIPENGNTASSTITVADAGTVVDVNIKFSITHPNDGDLQGWLYSPNGAVAGLFNRIGGTGDNFTNTALDDEPLTGPFIDTASAPFTGTYRPQGYLANLDGGVSNGTWTLSLRDWVKGNKGSLSNWSITVTYGIGPALSAPSEATASAAPAVTAGELGPLVAEAERRWEAAGVAPASLAGIDVQVADLGGPTLGLASGRTILIDGNAAGWGWFVDATPRDDSEFANPGDQGEQGRMDLLTVLMHEMGHALGLGHDDSGVMQDTLPAGTRRLPSAEEAGQALALGPGAGLGATGSAAGAPATSASPAAPAPRGVDGVFARLEARPFSWDEVTLALLLDREHPVRPGA